VRTAQNRPKPVRQCERDGDGPERSVWTVWVFGTLWLGRGHLTSLSTMLRYNIVLYHVARVLVVLVVVGRTVAPCLFKVLHWGFILMRYNESDSWHVTETGLLMFHLLMPARRVAVNKMRARCDLAVSVWRFYCQNFEHLFSLVFVVSSCTSQLF